MPALIERVAPIHPRVRIGTGDRLPAGPSHGRLCASHPGFSMQVGNLCL